MSLENRSRRAVLFFFPAIVVIIGLGCGGADTFEKGSCSPDITLARLNESLDLGTHFMLQHQRPDGNFDYEYDWMDGSYTPGDSQVRQAGAAWGLTLIFQDNPSDTLRNAIHRAVDFFRGHSGLTSDGKRFVVYPGEERGSLGTVALVALAHIDLLRAEPDALDPATRDRMGRELEEYLAFIVSAQHPDGRFHARYDLDEGQPFGEPSPYFDGESLLALVKAARYLDRDDLRPLVLEAADAGYRLNNVDARTIDPDSRITKGYYQWSSMVYFELATSGWEGTEKYGDWLIELADWMIDVHHTLDRNRNTAYAYEGIIPAYRVAVLRGDTEHAEKFGCTIEQGLAKLTSWQVGHSLANQYVSDSDPGDPEARGGVQNHRAEPLLRIDVAQHQMHAVVLARRYYWNQNGTDSGEVP
jgi:hypothetical protein